MLVQIGFCFPNGVFHLVDAENERSIYIAVYFAHHMGDHQSTDSPSKLENGGRLFSSEQVDEMGQAVCRHGPFSDGHSC